MQVLRKVRGGAVLYWCFDENDGVESALVCFLTHKEALAVAQRNYETEGVLEPVRASIRQCSALVAAIKADGAISAVPFLIPRLATEDEFVGTLFAAAEQACENFGRDVAPLPTRLHVDEHDLESAFSGRGGNLSYAI